MRDKLLDRPFAFHLGFQQGFGFQLLEGFKELVVGLLEESDSAQRFHRIAPIPGFSILGFA
jgi:hypothetical protein